MKSTVLSLSVILLAFLGSSAFILQKSSTGIQGYTGSPGEGTCNNFGCHNGGSSASSGITITAVPAFSVNINSETEYMPDSLYQISITVSASGYTKYGFASEILNTSSTNAGTLQTQGAGVKFLNAGQKRTATHTTAKTGSPAVFTFKWRAPSSDPATIYAIANAVNGNGSTSGDFVISPVSLDLVAAPVPVDTASHPDLTNINKNSFSPVSGITVFPNPAEGLSQISYYLKENGEVKIELVNMNGSAVKLLHLEKEIAGPYTQILNLQNIAPGAYFIKTSKDNKAASQKLIIIQ